MNLLSRFVDCLSASECPLVERSQPATPQIAALLSRLEGCGTSATQQSPSDLLKSLWEQYRAEEWEFGDVQFIPPQFASSRFLEFMQFVQFVIAVDVTSSEVYCYVEGDVASAFEVAPSLSTFLDGVAFLAARLSELPDDFDYRRPSDRQQKEQVLSEVCELVGASSESDAAGFWLNLV